jgi:hypothetical protein
VILTGVGTEAQDSIIAQLVDEREIKKPSALSLPTVLDRGYLATQIAHFLKCHPSNVSSALQKT